MGSRANTYYGDPLLSGVNALVSSSSSPYIVAKNSPEFSHRFRTISARTSFFFFFFFRDRKAYANNLSYRLPSSTKN